MRGAALTLVLVAALVGCGGQSPEERLHEQRDRQLEQWSNQEGAAWQAYAKGYDEGWGDGCFKTLRKIANESTLYPLCVGPGPGPDDSLDVSTYPPDFPRFEGRQAGFDAGCSHIYEHLRGSIPPTRFCERLRVNS